MHLKNLRYRYFLIFDCRLDFKNLKNLGLLEHPFKRFLEKVQILKYLK